MKNKVVILGGGIAGLSIARDLILRGFRVVVIERDKVGCGATTKCAGMLHSGVRYSISDPDLAELCHKENKIMKNIASFSVGKKDALFVVLDTDSKKFSNNFEESCRYSNIPIKYLSKKEVFNLEPLLNENVLGGYLAPDVVIDTFRLVEAYTFTLNRLGARILEGSYITRVVKTTSGWKIEVSSNKSINKITADYVVNATGDNIKESTLLFGVDLNLSYVHGTMAIINKVLSSRIVSRCAPNAVGDVVVPLVNGSLIGSTWHELGHNRPIRMSNSDRNDLFNASHLVFKKELDYKILSGFTTIRTHIKTNVHKGRFNIKRSYAVLDYCHNSRIEAFINVLPGKLTIARHVAEEVGDIISRRLGNKSKSITSTTPLLFPSKFKDQKIRFYV